MSDVLSKERIAEIELLKNTLPVVGTQCGDNVMVVVSLRDLLRERDTLLCLLQRADADEMGDERVWDDIKDTLRKAGRLT